MSRFAHWHGYSPASPSPHFACADRGERRAARMSKEERVCVLCADSERERAQATELRETVRQTPLVVRTAASRGGLGPRRRCRPRFHSQRDRKKHEQER
eukprot:3389828-Rhodomonas_salina.1